jgi:hypothetical protein
MGSFSSSTNVSSTAYTNAPIAQDNVTNPINLTNATGNRVGSDIVGSNIATLDGGAIDKAFSFGTEAVKIIADLTKSNNSALQNASGQAVQLASNAQASLDKNANGAANSDLFQNKTLIVAAVAVVVAYFYFRK